MTRAIDGAARTDAPSATDASKASAAHECRNRNAATSELASTSLCVRSKHGAILPPRVNVAETHIGQHGMHHTPVPHKALQLIGSDMLRQMSEVLLNLQHAECRRGGG